MRFLVNVQPAAGHFFPVVPTARALLAAGHDVLVATEPQGCSRVREAGLDAVELPAQDFNLEGGARRLRMAAAAPEDRARMARLLLQSTLEGEARKAPHLVEHIKAWQADAVLRETTAYAAWVAAEAADVPCASFDFSPSPSSRWAAPVNDLFDGLRASVGLPPDPGLQTLDQWLTIVGAPPGWFRPELLPPTGHLVQPPDYSGPVPPAPPAWMSALEGRTIVYVTLGGEFNKTPGVFEMIFEAIASERDLTFVVTVGSGVDPAQFGLWPSHVIVERFVAQSLVLDRAAAVISHGGYGSLMGALRRGLPVVSIPMAAGDNLPNAKRMARLGAGIVVNEADWSSTVIRTALRRVVDESGFRAAAREVAAGIAALPGADHAASLLIALAQSRVPLLTEPAQP